MSLTRRQSTLLAFVQAILFSIVGVVLMKVGDNAERIGACLIIIMPGIAGMLFAVHVHGVYAWCLAMAVSMVCLLVVVAIVLGVLHIVVMEFLLMPMIVAALIGTVLGIILRSRISS